MGTESRLIIYSANNLQTKQRKKTEMPYHQNKGHALRKGSKPIKEENKETKQKQKQKQKSRFIKRGDKD